MSPTELSELALELRIVADPTGLTPEQVKSAGHGMQEQPVAYDDARARYNDCIRHAEYSVHAFLSWWEPCLTLTFPSC